MKKVLLLLSSVLFVLCVSSSAWSTPYMGADIVQNGAEYTSSSSRWFVEGDSVWTAWAGQWVAYTVNLTEGTWNIGLNAINHGDLGNGWYSEFRISNSLTSETITIPASDDEEFFGFIQTEITSAGTYTVEYTWLNDKYQPPLDANIQITSVFFDDVNTAPVPEPATMMLFGIGLLGLAGVSRRKK